MNMRTRPQLLFAVAAIATGALGELLSPVLFSYGLSEDGVIVFHLLLICPFLLGLHITLGEIVRMREVTHSPSAPVLGKTGSEIPGTSAERFQAHLGGNSAVPTPAQMQLVVVTFLVLCILAIQFQVNGMLYEYPFLFVDDALFLLESASVFAGAFLAGGVVGLRAKKDHHRHIVLWELVTIILAPLLWVIAERAAYAMLSGYAEYLDLSDYIALARLSSEGLLVGVITVSLAFALPMCFEDLGAKDCEAGIDTCQDHTIPQGS